MNKRIKYLWVYSAADEITIKWHEKLLKRRKEMGYDIIGFCNTPESLNRRWLPFPELNMRWKSGDSALIKMYLSLMESIQGRDVLILYNGANLHPEFIKMLNILKVYTAGDDPESTEILTKPIAPVFDIHLINNIACLQMYRDWGLSNVHFWPLGSMSSIGEISDVNEDTILDPLLRKNPIIFCGGNTHWRQQRIEQLIKNFPNAFVCGTGMPQGYVSDEDLKNYYKNTQIGWNIHNSTGPINFRTYELPAYGVMQICDNKEHLDKIYKVGKEAIGFNSISECIELTQYYLDSVAEQREIALAGWNKWKKEYQPDQIWERLVKVVEPFYFSHQRDLSINIDTIKKGLISRERRWSRLNMAMLSLSNRSKMFMKKVM